MKKVLSVLAVMAGVFIFTVPVFGGQNIWSYVAKNFTGGGAALLNVDATGNLLESNGALATNAVSGPSVLIKAGVGRLTTINVLSASGVIDAYDSATVASATPGTEVVVIPATIGTYTFDWPMSSGIVINPSSSVVSVKYM